jgi:hypothetical protein
MIRIVLTLGRQLGDRFRSLCCCRFVCSRRGVSYPTRAPRTRLAIVNRHPRLRALSMTAMHFPMRRRSSMSSISASDNICQRRFCGCFRPLRCAGHDVPRRDDRGCDRDRCCSVDKQQTAPARRPFQPVSDRPFGDPLDSVTARDVPLTLNMKRLEHPGAAPHDRR